MAKDGEEQRDAENPYVPPPEADDKRPSSFVFVLPALLLGILMGFVPIDIAAMLSGERATSPRFVGIMIWAVGICGALAIGAGVVLARVIHVRQNREKAVLVIWGLFFAGIVLFQFVQPMFQRARE